ncbi:hypothetical protein D1007_56640 [Hordeum vulgare]|nr:hypothetical protein D1007_56640 [Hordeum vulgare]
MDMEVAMVVAIDMKVPMEVDIDMKMDMKVDMEVDIDIKMDMEVDINIKMDMKVDMEVGMDMKEGYEHEGEYEHEESAESATRNHEVRQEKEATILHKKAQEALLQKKLTPSTQKNFVLSSTAQHEVLQEKEATILQKKKATGLTQQSKDVALHRHKMATSKEVAITHKNQQLEVGQVHGKSRNATTSRLRRFLKGAQVDEDLEDFQAPEDLEDLQ